MPATLIPARLADARLAALISFAGNKKGVIGKNMNGNRLCLPLLARPTPNYATRSIESDTIDVPMIRPADCASAFEGTNNIPQRPAVNAAASPNRFHL
jgi:hypothetical protein